MNYKFLLPIAFLLLILIASCEKKKCEENIQFDCFVTLEVSPVCGCNDKTYGNPSEAACAGIVDYTDGACD